VNGSSPLVACVSAKGPNASCDKTTIQIEVHINVKEILTSSCGLNGLSAKTRDVGVSAGTNESYEGSAHAQNTKMPRLGSHQTQTC
jgi:hypothetical protein